MTTKKRVTLKSIVCGPSINFSGVIAALVLIAAGVMGTYAIMQQKVNDLDHTASRQRALIRTTNQACAGLGPVEEAPGLSVSKLTASQQLYDNDKVGRTASFSCLTGQNTKNATQGMDVASVDREGRDMGAEVVYFATSEQAKQYSSQVINPQRYWSVPNKELTRGVPMNSYFTSYIFGKPAYFDAYAIKGNAIIRLTLPCGDTTLTEAEIAHCTGHSVDEGAAISALRNFTDSVELLNF